MTIKLISQFDTGNGVQKLDLKQLMTDAKDDTKAFEKVSGDWRTQIQMLNRTVAVVTGYQKAINRVFGIPRYGWGEIPEGVVALEDYRDMERVSFQGAALLQTLQVTHPKSEGTTVKYKATLKVDENYFLGQMLPQVQKLRTADPDYTIYDLTIEVPKGELIAESLRMLSDQINNPPKESIEQPRQPITRESMIQDIIVRDLSGLRIGPSVAPPTFLPPGTLQRQPF